MEAGEPTGGLRQFDENIVRMLKLMTHEIRGPLVSVMAGLKVVRHGCYGAMESGVSDKLEDLHAHLNRLLGTADDFLAKACCVEGALPARREPLNLPDEILAAVLNELSGELQANRVLVQPRLDGMPAGTVLTANRLGMKIVYRNLIRNAMTHGGAGCTIVCGYQERPDHHRLNVFNSGVAIPSDRRERLFTKFGTLESPEAPRKAGIGLGLYLAREIVRSHGGAIWYEGRPGGSDFVFTVPKAPAPPPCSGCDFEI